MKAKLLSLSVGLALTVGASPLAAQHCDLGQVAGSTSCGVSVNTSVTVPSILSLDLSFVTQTLTSPQATDYSSGGAASIADNGPLATVKANRNWSLSINAQSASFTYTGAASPAPVKPVGDLKWSSVGPLAACGTATGFASLTGSGVPITSGGPTNNTTRKLCYVTGYTLTGDPAGSYALTIVYTVAGT
jgi:hypothetical protein